MRFRIASQIIAHFRFANIKEEMAKRSRSRSTDSIGGPPPKKFKPDENATMDFPINNVPQLNDDCLLEIFSYLPTNDLCAVRDCSRRLWGLAESIVEKRWKEIIHTVGVVDIAANIGEDLSLLTKFGKLIPHLSINDKSVFFQKKTDSLGSALAFCTSLKTLKLRSVDLSLMPINALENIEELEMGGCTGGDRLHLKIIKASKMLKRLQMAMNPKERLVTAINDLPNIESVCWVVYSATNSTFVNEVKKLSKLKKLNKLLVYGYTGYTFRGFSLSYRFPQVTETIRALSKSSSLQELNISYFDPDDHFFQALNNFANLKRCELSTYVEIPEASLAAATNFEIEKRNGENFLQYEYVLTAKGEI